MLSIAEHDLARMRGAVLFDGADSQAKLSRYWALLLLSAVIAAAGVVADSTATVIGAMIVAPLMAPILGTVLSIVAADVRNLTRCVLLVVCGAAAVVVVAWLVGKLVAVPVVADTRAEVAGRVQPQLIDLLAAVATGAVGSFALVREDVSDTLPGVAIAISLVPPLAVIGLTLESGASDEALGALLLFLTNVVAILVTGLIVMAVYRVPRLARRDPVGGQLEGRLATAAVLVAVIALVGPLAATSTRVTTDTLRTADIAQVARAWANERGWDVVSVDSRQDGVLVRTSGPLPVPDTSSLRVGLDAAGLESASVRLELVPTERVDLPGR